MVDFKGKIFRGRYRVEEFLGRKGMAEVYKEWDTQRGVPLVMKVLHDDLVGDVVFMRRFEREAQNGHTCSIRGKVRKWIKFNRSI